MFTTDFFAEIFDNVGKINIIKLSIFLIIYTMTLYITEKQNPDNFFNKLLIKISRIFFNKLLIKILQQIAY